MTSNAVQMCCQPQLLVVVLPEYWCKVGQKLFPWHTRLCWEWTWFSKDDSLSSQTTHSC